MELWINLICQLEGKKLLIVPNDMEQAVLRRLSALPQLVSYKVISFHTWLIDQMGKMDYRLFEKIIQLGYPFEHAKVIYQQLKLTDIWNPTTLPYTTKMNALLAFKEQLKIVAHQPSILPDQYDKVLFVFLDKTDERLMYYYHKWSTYSHVYQYTEIQKEAILAPVLVCATYYEEVKALAYRIGAALQAGISAEAILVVMPLAAYLPHIQQIFGFYHLAYTVEGAKPLYHYDVVKKLIRFLQATPYRAYSSWQTYLMAGLQAVFKHPISHNMQQIYTRVQSILQPFVVFEMTEAMQQIIIDQLKNAVLESSFDEEGGIRIVTTIPSMNRCCQQMYVLGCNQDVLPLTTKDNDYLTDDEKERCGLMTSLIKNHQFAEQFRDFLHHGSQVYMSYVVSAQGHLQVQSSVIDRLHLVLQHDSETKDVYYSRDDLQFTLIEALDLYEQFGTVSVGLARLLATGNPALYRSYQNQFTALAKEALASLQSQPIIISASALQEFNECPFRYYMRSILKIYPKENNTMRSLGTVFHQALKALLSQESHHPQVCIDQVVEQAQTNQASVRDGFYLERMKPFLTQVYAFHQSFHQVSQLKDRALEQSYTLAKQASDIPYTLKGIIDQTMMVTYEGITYCIVIDYKTGEPHNDLRKYPYGLDLQLPFYFYLIKQSHPRTVILGGYLERVLPSKVYPYSEKATFLQQCQKDYRLDGVSLDDATLLPLIDPDYAANTFVKLKYQSLGTKKLLDAATFSALTSLVEQKIVQMVEDVYHGKFTIKPKMDQDHPTDNTCQYCMYGELCYHRASDFQKMVLDKEITFKKEDCE